MTSPKDHVYLDNCGLLICDEAEVIINYSEILLIFYKPIYLVNLRFLLTIF